ncbi:hypothetical protein [Lactiplantibacillus pentosus]|uniref:hypothetical protein n=1 Tax=Lactiplantibacillus pentosus TaxID=1589 RepID=UPI0021A623CC|nr:hypothetical protein [Lactiplantibacillus pentosus]MCT3296943.1 hypothetical protein [Lactiplantibacillus pentosus]
MSPSCYFPLRLFFDDAVVEGANGVVANNPTKITSFFENFFKDNQELRHLYCISPNSDDYETEWGVAGCKKDGKLLVFNGFDRYKFNQQNKISFLKVEIIKWKSSH